jgi:rubrerythrin
LGLFDYFKPVSSWTVEEVRTVLRERSAESCNLVDVRQEAASIFRLLGQAEERHKGILRELHARVSGKGGDPEHPEEMEAGRFLEGGAPLEETLVWVQGKTVEEILELAIAMEANSLDRYIKMGRAVADERSREVFLALSREEQKHLERMTSLLDRLKP